MKKLLSVILVAGATAIAPPALAADDQGREAARKACPRAERCQEARRVIPWFYRGHDEEAQSRRRVVRRISADF